MINSNKYCSQLDQLKAALDKKHPELVSRKHIIFHQDNARPRVFLKTRQKLLQLGWEVLIHPPYFFFLIFIYLFIYLFMAVLGLRFCERAFPSCGEWGPLFIAVRGHLIIAASLVAEHRLQTRRLSNCGLRAPLLRGMWDLPRPGLEPVSPALAGRLSTTAPPGKPTSAIFTRHCTFRFPLISVFTKFS